MCASVRRGPLLRDADLDLVLRAPGLTVATLGCWRDAFLVRRMASPSTRRAHRRRSERLSARLTPLTGRSPPAPGVGVRASAAAAGSCRPMADAAWLDAIRAVARAIAPSRHRPPQSPSLAARRRHPRPCGEPALSAGLQGRRATPPGTGRVLARLRQHPAHQAAPLAAAKP